MGTLDKNLFSSAADEFLQYYFCVGSAAVVDDTRVIILYHLLEKFTVFTKCGVHASGLRYTVILPCFGGLQVVSPTVSWGMGGEN